MSSANVIELQEITLNIHQFVEENNLVALQNFLVDSDLADKRNSYQQTALHVACEKGNLEIVELLINRGANIAAKDVDDFTPLITASRAGSYAVVEFLVGRHQNIETTDKNGWTALMWASYKGHTLIVRFLLGEGASIHTSVGYNMTCLLWAAGRGFDSIVEMLCNEGAKVNHTDKFGNTPLLWASRYGCVKTVKCLLSHHADPNVVGGSGSSCLLMAMKGKHVKCVTALLENRRLNVNQTDRDGHTALSYAAKLGADQMLIQLLDREAFLNLADHHGDTALIKATKHGHFGSVKILLSKFADIDIRGKDAKTALHHACELGHVPLVKELLACEPNLEAKNSEHETALIRSVKEGNYGITKLLLNHGADVASTDKNHDTAIHCAVRSQNIQLLELLLRDPKNAQHLYRHNKFGETAYDIDNQHKKHILPTLFGLKGFSTAAISESSSYDIYSSALADMLTDPGFETPICVGLFAKWGSSVSLLLDKVQTQIGVFVGHSPWKKYRFSWITLFIVTFWSIFFGLLVGFLEPENAGAGSGAAFTVFLLPYCGIFLILFGVKVANWNWAKSAIFRLQHQENYIKLLNQICFMSYKHSEPSKMKVKFIFAGRFHITSTSKHPVADLISVIHNSVEKKVGRVAFRLARGFKDKIRTDSPSSWVFRKFCCIPSMIWFVIFLGGFTALLAIVIACYGPNHTIDVEESPNLLIIIYILSSVLGGLLLAFLVMFSAVLASLFMTPSAIKDKINKSATMGHTCLWQVCRVLQYIDAINKTNTRLCVLIDCLECRDSKQLQTLMEALRMSFAVKPIITLVSADHNLLSSTHEPSTTTFEEPHHIIQLPLFFIERKHKNKKKLMIKNGVMSSVHEMEAIDEIHWRQKKHFDLTRWLTSDDRVELIDPLHVKRIAIIVSYSARLIRAEGKDFSWPSLCCWIVLSELWPYTATCLVALVSIRNYETNKAIKAVYSEASGLFSSSHSFEKSTAYALQAFLKSKAFNLTVKDLKTFAGLTVNLDPKLQEYVPNFNELSANLQKSDMRSETISMASSFSTSESPVTNWSVDDVCYRFKAIPGLNSHNFPLYDSFIRKNNFHGLAIVSCELDELKKELRAPFGDWCLIRKFVMESKSHSAKAISMSSIDESELKSSDDKPYSKTPQSPVSSNFGGLSVSHRAAYDDAFKEYLKLQNPNAISTENIQTADENDNGNFPSSSMRMDNEESPLIAQRQFDINAN